MLELALKRGTGILLERSSSKHGVFSGYVTTEPPEGIRLTRDIWSGKIKIGDLQDHLLVRNVALDDHGRLSVDTVFLASKIKYPHHQGA